MAPHEEYEQAVQEFVDRILAPESPFFGDFREFQESIARHGVRNGLGQLLLKIASPGVPDFYQGTEFFQFSLVDPDNRRPVNFQLRKEMLETLRRRESEDRLGLVRELAANPSLDEMKLFVTYKALQYRKANRELFAHGEYIPVRAKGACAQHVCSFARRFDERWVVVVAPRWLVGVTDWGDTELVMPEGAPTEWQDVLTSLIPASLRIVDVLREFPVALLAH
jgi:(1->4)-alpha-D-glucan 1-alpha-D-glucosylmutase